MVETDFPRTGGAAWGRLALAPVLAATVVAALSGGPACTSSSLRDTPTRTPTATPAPNEVLATDTGWQPATLTVHVGATVRWVNRGALKHQVVSGTACTGGGSPMNSGDINPGSSWSFTFTATGTYPYTDPPCCSTMGVGTIVVQ